MDVGGTFFFPKFKNINVLIDFIKYIINLIGGIKKSGTFLCLPKIVIVEEEI